MPIGDTYALQSNPSEHGEININFEPLKDGSLIVRTVASRGGETVDIEITLDQHASRHFARWLAKELDAIPNP